MYFLNLVFQKYFFYSNIELQERLYQEVSNNVPIDKPVSQQDLSNLPLLKVSILEVKYY